MDMTTLTRRDSSPVLQSFHRIPVRPTPEDILNELCVIVQTSPDDPGPDPPGRHMSNLQETA